METLIASRSWKSSLGMFLLLAVSTFPANSESQKPVIKLATMEREPYSGTNLPNLGYVSELVTKVFERSGYQVEIEFFPPARVKFMAESGLVDGVMPVRFQQQNTELLSYSAPFPGAHQVFLKKKSTNVPLQIGSEKDIKNFFNAFPDSVYGIVRGTPFTVDFDHSASLKKIFVAENIQNLDILASGRIDFAIMDLFTAADSIVNYRPQYIGHFDFIRAHLFDSNFYLAFSKKRPQYEKLTIDFNQGLAALTNDGSLARILSTHGFFEPKMVDTSKRRLVIGAADINRIQCLQQRAKRFSLVHPDVEIEWRILNENTLRKRVLADFAVNNGTFDIIMIGEFETKIWGNNSWLVPFKNLPTDYQYQDYFPIARQALSHNGEAFALPVSAESAVTYYRKDLLEAAGLTLSENPEFDQIAKLAKALHQPDKGIYGIGIRGKAGWGQNMAAITMLVKSFGGKWFNKDGYPQLNTKEWRQALQFYIDLLQNYGPPDIHLNGWQENQRLFADGKLALMMDATVLADFLFDAKKSKVSDKIAMTSMPSTLPPQNAQWFWSWGLALPKSSQQQVLARELAVWLTSAAPKHDLTAECTHMFSNARQSVSLSSASDKHHYANYVLAKINSLKPVSSTNIDSTVVGEQFEAVPEFPAIGFQVGLIMRQVLEGKISVNAGLQESQQIVEKIMRDAGHID